jgi:hypothetical protein
MKAKLVLLITSFLITLKAHGLELICDGTGDYGAGRQTFSFKVSFEEHADTANYIETIPFLGKYIAKPWSLQSTDTNYVLTLTQHVTHVTTDNGNRGGLVLGLGSAGEGQIFQINQPCNRKVQFYF